MRQPPRFMFFSTLRIFRRFVLVGLFSGLAWSAPAAEPIKVLIIDGQNNHAWQTTTPLLKRLLEETGRFTVDVSTTPPALPRPPKLRKNATPAETAAHPAALKHYAAEEPAHTATATAIRAQWDAWTPNFSAYGVVISNYNGDRWPAKASAAFVAYVNGGGGMVSYHAADNSFADWPEFNAMIGLGGWGQPRRDENAGPYLRLRAGVWQKDATTPGLGGAHDAQREYVVENNAPDHPIMRGLPAQWMHAKDELYHSLRGPAENLTVLASARAIKTDEMEPMLMVIRYGQGRVFHTTLGHGADAINGLGFQATFTRGVEWAATGQVTLPAPAPGRLSPTTAAIRAVKLAPIPSASPAAPKISRPPALSPAESQKLFQLPPGYRLELVLSEPQIQAPVVTVFDGNGRMFVAEMRTYMQDIDGTNQKAATSRVSLHWSSRGDGVFDRHSVFIDGLVLPRILLPLKDSLLVQETDSGDIYEYRDRDGDGVAEEKKLFFSGENRTRANLEHQTSGLIWAQDNWLYTTYNSWRVRWTPQGAVKEPTAPNGGQWGVTQDDYGKPWFVNAGGELGPLNFQQPIVYGAFKVRNELAEGFKEVWPLVPIPDVQGGISRFRAVEKTLNHFSSTCGGEIFRGDRLPEDLNGDLLFCEPTGRLVRRAKITVNDGVTTLTNPYQAEKSEFIRSRDPYFRPVNLVTAPDGTLYITDMSRGIIQESNWTRPGSYLRDVIKEYGLDQNIGNGRIWRLVRDGQPLGPTPRMLDETPAQLVAHLAHPNGWWRDTAQKLLVLSQDKSVVPALTAVVRTHANPLARQHALWTLEGLDALTAVLVLEKLADTDPHVRVAAIRASETLFKRGDRSLQPEILARYQDADPTIAIQAMMTAHLLQWPEAKPLTQQVATASAPAGVRAVAAQLLHPLSGQIPAGFGEPELKMLERGQEAYMQLCFACHGLDGKGTPLEGKSATLAPPLASSATVAAQRDALIAVLLHGVSGPINLVTYDAQMVPMGANDDDWIAAVASYVRVGFGNKGSLVTAADVSRVRTATALRNEPWTISELQARTPQPLDRRSAWKFTSNRAPDTAHGGTFTFPLTVEAAQTSGAAVTLELPEPATISDVRVVCSRSPRKYQYAFKIECSLDGAEWTAAGSSERFSGPNIEISFPPTRARWIRLTQTAPAAKVPWVLDDVIVYQPPSSVAANGAPAKPSMETRH